MSPRAQADGDAGLPFILDCGCSRLKMEAGLCCTYDKDGSERQVTPVPPPLASMEREAPPSVGWDAAYVILAGWELGRVGCTIETDPFVGEEALVGQALHFDTGCRVHLEGERVGDNPWTRRALEHAAEFLADPRLDSRATSEDPPGLEEFASFWGTIADILVAHSDQSRAARAAAMPDEEAALKVMYEAYERLAELGWRRGFAGAPRDGRTIEVIEAGSTGTHPCHHFGGYWIVGDGTHAGPSHPIMWRPAREVSRG